jgi:hypothetical protein
MVQNARYVLKNGVKIKIERPEIGLKLCFQVSIFAKKGGFGCCIL